MSLNDAGGILYSQTALWREVDKFGSLRRRGSSCGRKSENLQSSRKWSAAKFHHWGSIEIISERNTWYVRARSVEASLDVAHQWLDDYWANICPCLPNVCLWLLLRTRECCPSLQLMLASVLPCACIWLCFISWYWRVLYLACIDAVLYTTYLYHALQNGKDHLPTMDGNQLVDIENHCRKISSLRNPKTTPPTILKGTNPLKNLNKLIKKSWQRENNWLYVLYGVDSMHSGRTVGPRGDHFKANQLWGFLHRMKYLPM